MSFPEIVGQLINNGVAYYHVDYTQLSITYYGVAGAVVITPISCADFPVIPNQFNAEVLKHVIKDSQVNGQHFNDFCRRAMAAGLQGYFAFLQGKRVVYYGAKGDIHTEWFPGFKSDVS